MTFLATPGPLLRQVGVIDFAPVDYGHEELAFAVDGEADEVSTFSAGAVFEEGDDALAPETIRFMPRPFFAKGRFIKKVVSWDAATHRWRSRLRSPRSDFRAEGSLWEPRRLRMNSGVKMFPDSTQSPRTPSSSHQSKVGT